MIICIVTDFVKILNNELRLEYKELKVTRRAAVCDCTADYGSVRYEGQGRSLPEIFPVACIQVSHKTLMCQILTVVGAAEQMTK